MASDDGHNAWVTNYRSPSRSAFDGPLPNRQLWRFPRAGMIDLVVPRIASSMREEWFGTHLALLPQLPRKPWFPTLPLYGRVLEWNRGAQLFAYSSTDQRKWVPVVDGIRWAVSRSTRNA